MKKTNLVLATILTGIIGFGSVAATAGSGDGDGKGERSWKQHSGQYHGEKHGKRGGRHGGGKHMMGRMAKKLGLTDDQQAQIKAFRETQKTNNQALHEETKQMRQSMQSLDRSDAAAVALIAEKKGNLTQRMFIARTESRQAFTTFIEGFLTAEQKTNMAEIKAKRQLRRT